MSRMPLVQDADAPTDVAEMYEEIKREMGIPFVPNMDRALALAPNALKGTWEALRNVFLQTNLPMTLATMILLSVSAANKCKYCAPIFKATCMTVGVDEDSLAALDKDLEGLAPERVHAIVKFARKCALDRGNLSDVDFDEVRALGVSDEEIVEIISLAALANYLNTVADSMQIDLDEAISAALAA